MLTRFAVRKERLAANPAATSKLDLCPLSLFPGFQIVSLCLFSLTKPNKINLFRSNAARLFTPRILIFPKRDA